MLGRRLNNTNAACFGLQLRYELYPPRFASLGLPVWRRKSSWLASWQPELSPTEKWRRTWHTWNTRHTWNTVQRGVQIQSSKKSTHQNPLRKLSLTLASWTPTTLRLLGEQRCFDLFLLAYGFADNSASRLGANPSALFLRPCYICTSNP